LTHSQRYECALGTANFADPGESGQLAHRLRAAELRKVYGKTPTDMRGKMKEARERLDNGAAVKDSKTHAGRLAGLLGPPHWPRRTAKSPPKSYTPTSAVATLSLSRSRQSGSTS
jgi:hypothetical protein